MSHLFLKSVHLCRKNTKVPQPFVEHTHTRTHTHSKPLWSVWVLLAARSRLIRLTSHWEGCRSSPSAYPEFHSAAVCCSLDAQQDSGKIQGVFGALTLVKKSHIRRKSDRKKKKNQFCGWKLSWWQCCCSEIVPGGRTTDYLGFLLLTTTILAVLGITARGQ